MMWWHQQTQIFGMATVLTLVSSVAVGQGSERACTPGANTLCLLSSQFSAEVVWTDSDTNTDNGAVVPFGTDTSGFFWFTDSRYIDLAVQMFDGCAINNDYWVFTAGLSDFEQTLTVTETDLSGIQNYFNPLGTYLNVLDTSAFPCGGPERSHASGIDTLATDVERSAWATRLYFADGRFAVDVVWRDFQDNMGSGQGVAVTSHSGVFWFFSTDRWEIVVKMVDGSADNGFFWFVASGFTNVEYSISVTDICGGTKKTYTNPLGVTETIVDETAFPATTDCFIFADGFESGDTTAWSFP